MEKYVSFLKENKNRNDSIGKISQVLLDDKKFNEVSTEQEFINYVDSISSGRPELSDAVLDLKKELGL